MQDKREHRIVRPLIAAGRYREEMLRLNVIIAVLSLNFATCGAQAAPSCDQFKAAIIEGATLNRIPAPTFTLAPINEPDADLTYWTIASFADVRTMMLCERGVVQVFAVDAKDAEAQSSLHFVLLTAIGLYAYGMEWPPAIDFRDDLLRVASESRSAYSRIEGAKVSLVVNAEGVPSFQIDTESQGWVRDTR
jgi:hypothetical protein